MRESLSKTAISSQNFLRAIGSKFVDEAAELALSASDTYVYSEVMYVLM
jgi:hypothetical protein